MTYEELNTVADVAIRTSDRHALTGVIRSAEQVLPTCSGDERSLVTAGLSFWRGFERFLGAQYPEAIAQLELATSQFDAVGLPIFQARAISCVGACYQFMGDFDTAMLLMQQALQMHTAVNNVRGIATSTGNLGNLLMVAGRYEEALESFTSALRNHQEIADTDGVARTLGNIGNLYKETENYEEAMRYYEESLALYHELGDSAGIGRVVGSLGGAYLAVGKYPESLEAFHRAMALFEELGDRRRVARTATNIGIIYKHLHDYQTCQHMFAEALAQFEKIADKEAIAHVTGNIGECYLEENEFSDAYEWLSKAIVRTREVGNRRDEAHYVANLVEVCLKLGNVDEARSLLHDNKQLTSDIPSVRVSFLQGRAAIAGIDEQPSEQHILLEQALEIAEHHQLRSKQIDLHHTLRDLHRREGELETYIYHDERYERLLIQTQGETQQRRLAVAMVERKISLERRASERQRALLHNTLPAHIADRLLKEETTVADLHENVGILFLDIVAFTSVASEMEPRLLVELLNSVFSICDDIAQSYGLTKIKTIGDAYLAVSGLSDKREEHIVDLAHAAIQIQQRLLEQDLVVRVGVHCGPIVAGVIGKERLQYDIWGDAVNVAARMEQTCEPGRVQCSEAVATQLLQSEERSKIKNQESNVDRDAPGLHVTLRGELDIKGKGRMRTYWLEKA